MNWSRNVMYYGTTEELPELRTLRAGPLTLILEDGALRYIRLGETEVFRRVYVAVRVRDWLTIPPRYSDFKIQQNANSFVVEFNAEHANGEVDFRWHGMITGSEDGTIRYTMEGQVHKSFWRNRIGFCVLHPMSAAGSKVHVEHGDGSYDESLFPIEIAPQLVVNGQTRPVAPFEEMRSLAHQVREGIWAKVEFSGDLFEMEDQRNWTDASFKTYSTPLSLPFPVEVHAGESVSQAVTLTVDGVIADTTLKAQEIAITWDDLQTHRLPRIGLGSASHGQPLTELECARLRTLSPDHLRIDLDPAASDLEERLERAREEANSIGAALEVALFLSNDATHELERIKSVLKRVKPNVVRWLVFHKNEPSTAGRWRELARESLGTFDATIPVYGGTNIFFMHLNREHQPCEAMDGVSYSVNPQEHAFDVRSLAECPPAIGVTIATARTICESRPLSISPISLRRRFNPHIVGAQPAPPVGELPANVDPRQMSLFGAGWTLAALKAVAEAGLESVTFYETTGWRGVMETDAPLPLPDKFGSRANMVFPLYYIFADAAERRDAVVVKSVSSEPLRVESLLLRSGNKFRLLASNLTNERQEICVKKVAADRAFLARLNELTFELATMQANEFRAQELEQSQVINGRLDLVLLPFESLRADWMSEQMRLMRAIALEAPYQLTMQEQEIPAPQAGEVLIQTRANGICGSDLHYFHGTHPYRKYPMYPGHEGTGRVAELGEGVTGFEKGDAVIIEPLIPCGYCYPCRVGKTNCCSNMKMVGLTIPGSLSEYFVVPAASLYKVSGEIPSHLAALVEPFSIGFQAVARADVSGADFVAIIGAGPIGLATLAAAKERGAKVAIMDLLDSRLALATSFGADVVINSKENNPADVLREWTGGDMPGVLIEAVGGPRTMELAIQLVADAGRVVIVGVTEQAAQIRGVDLTRKELSVFGSRNNLHQFQNTIDYVIANAAVAEKMVTQIFPLEKTAEAFELARLHPEQVAKIIIHLAD